MDNEFITCVSDMLTTDDSMFNIMKRNDLLTRADFWQWLSDQYGAERCGIVKSKRFGYASIGVRFPNKATYMEFCLKWL